MDTAQWPQGIGVVKPVDQKKPRPQKEQALNCPRCSSTNTKFCYYNNYSLTQPRYFCKTCRRYWTEGGSLRNVPVGGGSRKHKRPSPSPPSSSSSKKLIDNLTPPNFPSPPQNPKFHDLNLAYNPSSSSSQYFGLSDQLVAFPFGLGPKSSDDHGLGPLNPNFIPFVSGNGVQVSDSGYDDRVKPCLGFSVDDVGLQNGYGNLQGVDQDHQYHQQYRQQISGRNNGVVFPLEELKNREEEFEEDDRGGGGGSNGFWSGMLGGGGSW